MPRNPKRQKKTKVSEFFSYVGLEPKKVKQVLQDKESYYKVWHKKEPNGKKRVIEAPRKTLKKMQRSILDRVEFRPGPWAHGGVRKKSIRTNALAHKGSKFLVRIDIKNAYPSLTKQMVKDHFLKMNAGVGLAKVLTELITFRGHLPQGAPTSLSVFNHFLSLAGLDDAFSLIRVKKHSLKYSRYVDDLTFTSLFKIPPGLENAVAKKLKEFGFTVNPAKTLRYSTKNRALRITGVNLINNKPKVPPKKIKKFRGMIGRATIDGSVSSAKIFGTVAYVMGIEKRIPHQLLVPLLKYLKARQINCPPKIKKQIDRQTKK